MIEQIGGSASGSLIYRVGLNELDDFLNTLKSLELDEGVTFKRKSEPDGPNGQMTMYYWEAEVNLG